MRSYIARCQPLPIALGAGFLSNMGSRLEAQCKTTLDLGELVRIVVGHLGVLLGAKKGSLVILIKGESYGAKWRLRSGERTRSLNAQELREIDLASESISSPARLRRQIFAGGKSVGVLDFYSRGCTSAFFATDRCVLDPVVAMLSLAAQARELELVNHTLMEERESLTSGLIMRIRKSSMLQQLLHVRATVQVGTSAFAQQLAQLVFKGIDCGAAAAVLFRKEKGPIVSMKGDNGVLRRKLARAIRHHMKALRNAEGVTHVSYLGTSRESSMRPLGSILFAPVAASGCNSGFLAVARVMQQDRFTAQDGSALELAAALIDRAITGGS